MSTKRTETPHAHRRAHASPDAELGDDAPDAAPAVAAQAAAAAVPTSAAAVASPVIASAAASPALAPAPAADPAPLPLGTDLEDAEAAYKRVEPQALALPVDKLSALNVEVVSATSIILGVAARVVAYRARMATLPEFDLHNVDELVDRAKAAWFAAITNLPAPEGKDFQTMLDEATALRQHLLTWALPLVHAQKFDQVALDQIKDGSGNKDTASDVVALVALYRSKWNEIRTMCGVQEADLNRGAVLGPALFAAVSRRENKGMPSLSDGSLKMRRFWTLADVAYHQCRRAISYFEWELDDIAAIAPSLRRNAGPRSTSPATPPGPTPTPTPAPSPPPIVTPTVATQPAASNGAQLGGAHEPFAK